VDYHDPPTCDTDFIGHTTYFLVLFILMLLPAIPVIIQEIRSALRNRRI
jgi:hypothetical protein